jgi:hypothetical protein
VAISEELAGNWTTGHLDNGEEQFLRISTDGRLAQFYKQHPGLDRHIGATMHANSEGGHTFRIRVKPDTEGYLLEMYRDDAKLVIVNRDQTTVWHPVAATAVPLWWEEAQSRLVWS